MASKQDLIKGLERELGYYRFTGDDHRARQVREQLAALKPKPKAETPERDGDKAERAVVDPAAEKAVVRRTRSKKA